MIRHVIQFNFKPELEESERVWILDRMRGLSKLPPVHHLVVGKLLEPKEDWYKQRICTDYAWTITLDFEDEAGLYAYQTDPYHVTVAQEIRQRVTVIKVSDFVLG